ncbi:beta,beta-carotene 15,15'-dioxygenase isoform X1 [Bufo gargarizans]|uniref:beta,beta-carotene 15,15'-dioxygenase isoform X1 n=2 Tax=Bufo gargarizans TaxID=30331 RepID=UPI001CF3F5CC|nr:beta,beta-carotene 15,15'-dioxygenase isoform X1 [Bufo gargarizans]
MEQREDKVESVVGVIFSKNRQECPEPIKAEVQGSIPKWLQGTLIRNGPGIHSVGEMSYNHWFDGLSLLHSFTFRNGEVHYRSKFLRSDTYNCNMEANRIVVSEFGTMAYPDPCKNIFAKAFTYLSHVVPEFTDNCLINIIRFGNDYYASSETNFIRKIDPQSLDTLEKVDYLKHVTVNLATSHPHYDNEGNTFNMGTSIGDKGKTKYIIFKVPSKIPDKDKKKSPLKSAEVLCSIPAHRLLSPSYYHSFGMTENYVILIEQPLKLEIVKLATAYFRGVNWASCITFYNDEKTWFHIIDKRTKKPVGEKFYSDALVFYHHVNAYEEDGHVVFDIIAYKDNSLYEMFYMANLRKELSEEAVLTSVPSCKRFVVPVHYDKKADVGVNLVKIPTTTATAVKDKDGQIYCHPETLCEGIELPRINYDYNGKKYRYVYASHVEWRPIPTKIVKFDTVTKQMLSWSDEMCWPAEPLFLPDPDGKDEDDGIILSSIVSSNPKKSSFLLVLDAKTFKELGRASVNASVHLDLHGLFIPDNNN